eukprot:TRINITY_DN1404_c0_g1_i2.p1 TRINITY_DN1404_c0_g1~~TRINITY_DN1404_c0_g1_i2.p1  ORF type:complete len:678 (-),score=66.20 TRINITY_DN1404_c0_g1_i2:133-2166(-)
MAEAQIKKMQRCANWRRDAVGQERRALRGVRSRHRLQNRQRRSYWCANTGIFDHDKVIIARIRRMTMHELSTRSQACNVHTVGSVQVPEPVIAFLGKGDKLVPTKKPISWVNFLDACNEFRGTVLRSFAAREWQRSGDPLQGLRRRFYNPRSSWVPDATKVPAGCEEFCRRIQGDIAINLQHICSSKQAGGNNLSFGDYWAIQWLHNNPQVIDSQCDKGLGTAILSRDKYDEFAIGCIDKNYTQIQITEVAAIIERTKRAIVDVMQFALDFRVVEEVHVKYAQCLFDTFRLPIGRLLIKVHKDPVAARLLASGTTWITNPVAVLVAVALQEVVSTFDSVAQDTQNVVDLLNTLTQANPDDHHVCTFDVEQLYPSICHIHCKAIIRRALVDFFEGKFMWGAKFDAYMRMIDILLQNQLLTYRCRHDATARVFIQVSGVTTGLACATQISNLYLTGMDKQYAAQVNILLLGYRRFGDDVCTVAHKSLTVTRQAEILSSFHGNIKVTTDAEDTPTQATFLDLNITLSNGGFQYETYRKPKCTYSYLPFVSCHAKAVKGAVRFTEFTRLLRTNSDEASFNKHADLFTAKLMKRGYPLDFIQSIRQRRSWKHKHVVLEAARMPKKKIIPFKLCYFRGAERLKVGHILNKHSKGIDADIEGYKFVCCFRSNANLFRKRYAHYL